MFLALLLMKSLFSNIYNLQEYVQIYKSDFKNKKKYITGQSFALDYSAIKIQKSV